MFKDLTITSSRYRGIVGRMRLGFVDVQYYFRMRSKSLLCTKDNKMTDNEIWIYCNKCQHETCHAPLFQEKKTWSDEVHPIDGGDEYIVGQCKGCKEITYQQRTWFSEDCQPDGTLNFKIGRYPPKTLRKKPKWFSRLHIVHVLSSGGFTILHNEIYIALQNNCKSLAVMGIRALLEKIMIEKCGDNGSFIKNLNKFEQDGYISSIQKSALNTVIEAGHATMHRSYEPKSEEVLSALDITENIIESIYINETKAEVINKTVPKRK